MILRLKSHFFVLLSMVLATRGVKAKVTPLEKVTSLLKDLSGKLAAEGKEEAAQYDKYAVFCKEQSERKQHAMEKSEAIIEHLRSDIEALETARGSLANDMMKLSLKISDLEDKITEGQSEQDHHHAKYLQQANDMTEAIDACTDAISQLSQSKSQLLNVKLDLMQVTRKLVQVIERQPLLTEAPGAVTLLSMLNRRKAAPKSEYQSSEVIATLEDLLATFKTMKKTLALDEFTVNGAFEKERLGFFNEKKLAEKERAGTELLVSAKTEKLQSAKVRMADEDDDYWADSDFLSQLRDECGDKAVLFGERSQARGMELTTLAKATTELEKEAIPNYKGNGALLSLQTNTVGQIGKSPPRPVMLAQLRSAEQRQLRNERALDRVQSFLADAADRIGSRALTNMVWHMKSLWLSRLAALQKSGELESSGLLNTMDEIDSARGMVQGLLQKLQDDSEDDRKQKEKCDEVMKRRARHRDSTSEDLVVVAGTLAVMRDNKKTIQDDTDVLRDQAGELRKALREFNDLHSEDMKVKDDAIDMCEKGVEAVRFALTVLKNFYQPLLAQTSTSVTVANTEREGEKLPAVFDSAYHGARVESEGIVGILEVILADFEHSKDAAEQDRREAQQKTLKFEKAAAADIKTKTEKIDKNAAEIAHIDGLITDEEEMLRHKKQLRTNRLGVVEVSTVECVQGETWTKRKRARDNEMEALKEAHAMLEDSRLALAGDARSR